MKWLKSIYVFVALIVIGAFVTIGSYDLGTHAGTKEIVTTSNGMQQHRFDVNEDKIKASIEAYKGLGNVITFIGGVGLVIILTKDCSKR